MRIAWPRFGNLELFASLTCLFAGIGLAQADPVKLWGPAGVRVGPAFADQDVYRFVADGEGGLFAIWRDDRKTINSINSSFNEVYWQHIDGSGTVPPPWLAPGQPIASRDSAYQYPYEIVSDARGGAIALWSEQVPYSPSNGEKFYLTRFPAIGGASGWENIPGARALPTGISGNIAMCADGSGGVYVAWINTLSRVRLLRVLANGDTAPGWLPEGSPATPDVQPQIKVSIAEAHGGGVYVSWKTGAPWVRQTWVQRLAGDGQISAGWPVQGVACQAHSSASPAGSIATDGAGNVVVTWPDLRGLEHNPFVDQIPAPLFSQHVLANGTRDVSWPEDGLDACDFHCLDVQSFKDGVGGVLLAGQGYQDQAVVNRLQSDGSRPSGWPFLGIVVGQNVEWPAVAPDGQGGAYSGWRQFDGSTNSIMATHVLHDGVVDPAWGNPGFNLTQGGPDKYLGPVIAAPDGLGGLLCGYSDFSASEVLLVFTAQRIHADGPTPTLLAAVDAIEQDDRVRIRWQGINASTVHAEVERTEDGLTWNVRGNPCLVGADLLQFEETNVAAGRHGYRLRERDNAFATDPIWIEVTNSSSIALSGFVPNPARSASATVSFRLADARPAKLTVRDVRGRFLFNRSVGELGPGAHVVSITGNGLAAGIYWIGLEAGSHTLTQRGIVLP